MPANDQPQFNGNPTFTVDPSGRAPLTAMFEFETDIPCAAVLAVDGGNDSWRRLIEADGERAHRVPVLGLKPDTEYRLEIILSKGDGELPAGERFGVDHKTDPLPDDFPIFNIRICDDEDRDYGYFLFALRNSGAAETAPGNGRIVAINLMGEVVWLFNQGGNLADFRRLQNGNLMYVTRGAVVEIDMLGTELNRWSGRSAGGRTTEGGGIALDMEGIHHAAMELPNGNLVAIGIEVRRLAAYPTSETDPDAPKAPADVKGDTIVEFDRSGKIVNTTSLFDILDVDRIGYYSVTSGEGGGPGGDGDWSHANGIDYDPADDSYVISVRHQDCIIKIGREKGELRWILGDHTGWGEAWQKYLLEPIGDVGWPYHQHDPSFTMSGGILCFDNGNCRAIPFNPRMAPADSYSRLVEYEVDEENRTVKQLWAFGGENGEKIYASSQGGAVEVPGTGTFFGTFACCRFGPDGKPSESNRGDARRMARFIEFYKGFDTESVINGDPEVVFDLEFQDRSDDAKDFSSFRSIHLIGLYPPKPFSPPN